MNDIISLEDVRNVKNIEELRTYAEKIYGVLQIALSDNKKLQQEVDHLKELIVNSVPLLENCKTIIKSPAEIICELQIERLQEDAMARKLTLEETKQLDLLIKNKRLLNGDSTIINGNAKRLDKKNISDAELISLALIKDNKKQADNE
jgi:hypothetical protein